MTRVDLTTGERNVLPQAAVSALAIASNGTALVILAHGGGFALVDLQGNSSALPNGVTGASLSDDGLKVVYTKSARGLFTSDGTGIEIRLGPHLDVSDPVISGDGKAAIYIQTSNGAGQLFFIQTSGGGLKQLTNLPEGITACILSGEPPPAYPTQSEKPARLEMRTTSGLECRQP